MRTLGALPTFRADSCFDLPSCQNVFSFARICLYRGSYFHPSASNFIRCFIFHHAFSCEVEGFILFWQTAKNDVFTGTRFAMIRFSKGMFPSLRTTIEKMILCPW